MWSCFFTFSVMCWVQLTPKSTWMGRVERALSLIQKWHLYDCYPWCSILSHNVFDVSNHFPTFPIYLAMRILIMKLLTITLRLICQSLSNFMLVVMMYMFLLVPYEALQLYLYIFQCNIRVNCWLELHMHSLASIIWFMNWWSELWYARITPILQRRTVCMIPQFHSTMHSPGTSAGLYVQCTYIIQVHCRQFGSYLHGSASSI